MVLGVILVSFGDLGHTFSDFEGIGSRLEILLFLGDSLWGAQIQATRSLGGRKYAPCVGSSNRLANHQCADLQELNHQLLICKHLKADTRLAN